MRVKRGMKGTYMRKIPENYSNMITAIHKEKGREWLNNLPSLISYCEKKWNFYIQEPYELSYNYVAPVICRDGKKLVLKLSVPNHEFEDELTAISLYKNNKGMVNLIDCEKETGIMLLEQLVPGIPLSTIKNDQATTLLAAQVMRQLWKEAHLHTPLKTTQQNEFSLKRIIQQNPNGIGPFSIDLLLNVLSIFSRLNSSIQKYYVLHGDLHHYNILSCHARGWVAIDPKGLVGEREYDVIQFLLNRLPNDNKTHVIQKRIEIFVEQLDLNKERLLLWGYVHSILSVCWSIEEGGDCNKDFFEVVDIFNRLYLSEFPNGGYGKQ
ncbi:MULTISPECIES: aminoglycoside phosphotransferase family protein [Bacillus]|uniref:aminoglycoside phosphotransferase family protein n=1 Tax=Bacillus TaxID=1386 RepID=UPI000BB701D5|nr:MULTISPECIES: aminoglycoside phosphotransferase family protein [Bacillus]